MQEMGIGFEDAGQLMQQILDLSAGHPNLVQYVCQQLLLQLNTRRGRFVTLADLNTIADSAQFGEYAIEVIWGDSSPLERLILLLMLDRPAAGAEQLRDDLREYHLDAPSQAVERALKHLTLASILNQDEKAYCFASAAFPSIVTLTHDLETLLQRTLRAAHCQMAAQSLT
jgi:hypothetical protein